MCVGATIMCNFTHLPAGQSAAKFCREHLQYLISIHRRYGEETPVGWLLRKLYIHRSIVFCKRRERPVSLTKRSRIVLNIHLGLQPRVRYLRHRHRAQVGYQCKEDKAKQWKTVLVWKETDLCNKRITGSVETKCHRQRLVHSTVSDTKHPHSTNRHAIWGLREEMNCFEYCAGHLPHEFAKFGFGKTQLCTIISAELFSSTVSAMGLV